MPKIGHPIMRIKNPIPNEIVPLKLLRFIKNCIVDFRPMVKDTPETNRILAIIHLKGNHFTNNSDVQAPFLIYKT